MSTRKPVPPPQPDSIDRRVALKGLAALGIAQGLPLGGCAPGEEPGTGPDDDSSGDPVPGAIDTIVLVMMENRTFDHYFGHLSLEQGRDDVDGLRPGMSNPDLEGVPVEPFYLEEGCSEDPPHGWDSSHEQWNGGVNDGFVRQHSEDVGAEEGRKVMGYYREADLSVHHAIARSGALCQKWFASVMGPTWPNRIYGHAAQSQGMKSNDFPDNPDGAFGFTCRTIWDQLTEAGISWAYYYSDLPFLALFGTMAEEATDRFRPLERYFEDAAAGTLPQVVWVDPAFSLNDDHPPHHVGLGQMFVATVFQALASSPHWERSLFVLTYDEHGGFFDHVPPPTIADDRADEGFDQLGFRVPSFVAGPFVKEGHVSETVYDHTSWIKQTQRMFDLPPLTLRNEAANDLQDLIDEDRLARNEPRPPPKLPVVEVTEEELDAACRVPIDDDLHRAADRGWIPAHLDRRPLRRQLLQEIGARAERLGVGRIVRRGD